MKKIIIALLALLVIAVLSFFIFKDNQPSKDTAAITIKNDKQTISSSNASLASQNLALLSPTSEDIVLGSPDAQVTLVEYASLSCPHCASFYRDAFPRLRTEYIDTGKVKFVYRHFPLNGPALAASVLSDCYAQKLSINDKVEKYHSFIKALFQTQESWAFTEHFIEKLESVAKLSGMSGDEVKVCFDNDVIREKISQRGFDAAKKLQIDSTPTFFVNGEKIGGYSNYNNMKNIIEKYLSKTP